MARAKRRGQRKKPAPTFVLDNSITMAWIFEDETDAYAEAVLRRIATHRAIVPSLWPLEVINALIGGERRKRIAEAKISRWINVLTGLPINIDDETNVRAWNETLNLARGHKLSSYDAAYLELAIRRDLPLATIDKDLRNAANAVGETLFERP